MFKNVVSLPACVFRGGLYRGSSLCGDHQAVVVERSVSSKRGGGESRELRVGVITKGFTLSRGGGTLYTWVLTRGVYIYGGAFFSVFSPPLGGRRDVTAALNT